jgi:hypothetical protein
LDGVRRGRCGRVPSTAVRRARRGAQRALVDAKGREDAGPAIGRSSGPPAASTGPPRARTARAARAGRVGPHSSTAAQLGQLDGGALDGPALTRPGPDVGSTAGGRPDVRRQTAGRPPRPCARAPARGRARRLHSSGSSRSSRCSSGPWSARRSARVRADSTAPPAQAAPGTECNDRPYKPDPWMTCYRKRSQARRRRTVAAGQKRPSPIRADWSTHHPSKR